MRYLIRANFIEEKKGDLFKKLSDGTIAGQKPDGKEILASMRRARIVAPGMIEWCETCYCATPLDHERATVYDHYLTDIQTQEIESDPDIVGHSFLEHLQEAK